MKKKKNNRKLIIRIVAIVCAALMLGSVFLVAIYASSGAM